MTQNYTLSKQEFIFLYINLLSENLSLTENEVTNINFYYSLAIPVIMFHVKAVISLGKNEFSGTHHSEELRTSN